MIVDSLLRPRRCRECGEGLIRPLAREGRVMPYKNGLALPVPADLFIPTCSDCGSEWIDEPTAHALDNALEDAYIAHLDRECARLIRQVADRYREMAERLRSLRASWPRRRES